MPKINEKDINEKELERKIKGELHKKLGIEISKVRFEGTDEDDVVHVFVHVKKSKKPIIKDIAYYIISLTSDLLQTSGFDKFPIVFTRLNSKQELAA